MLGAGSCRGPLLSFCRRGRWVGGRVVVGVGVVGCIAGRDYW